MKKITLVVLTLVMIIIFSGCFNKSNIIITNYETNSIVTEFSSKDYPNEAASLTNMLNDLSDETMQTKNSPNYEVHFIDPKDSENDIWFYVYEADNDIYIQIEPEKMTNSLLPIIDNSIKKSTNITAKEFREIISKDY